MLTNEDSPGGGGSPWPRQRFICDQHLGALARLLRQLGFDTAWHAGLLEPEMARRCVNEDRVALTRNRQLLQRKSLGPAPAGGQRPARRAGPCRSLPIST